MLSLGSLIGALTTARRSTVTSRNLIASSAGFGVAHARCWPRSRASGPPSPSASPSATPASGFLTSSTAIVQLLADPAYRGRVLALQAMVFLGSTPIGGPIVGWVSDVGGPRAGLVVGGVACLAAALYGFRALRDVEPKRPDEAPPGSPRRCPTRPSPSPTEPGWAA